MRCISNRPRRSKKGAAPAIAVGAAVVLALTGCADDAGSAQNPDDGVISVVTSTNVYGDIAETVGGDNVEVTPIIDSVSQDPHSYEATVRDKLAVTKAELVVENGGGYDAFLHRLVEDTESGDRAVVTAVELSGLQDDGGSHAGHEEEADSHAGHEEEAGSHAGHSHAEFNEHVWYDLATVSAVATKIADRLSALDSANAETYRANAAEFTASIEQLQQRVDGIKDRHGGEGVAITEPVPLHLLEDSGLINKTPAEFSQAVEEGNGVSPVVLQETLNLFSEGRVELLAYNEQTEGSQTQAVAAAARKAGVPVVNFTETLPDGKGYLSWMSANVDNIERALAQ
ncbi:MAG TPA: zinc ABC transporter substrate-binding protein [Arthrobacter sp.]|nr:zinc ABC transporter substrate-binding protein [Arthrobacter sp.]